MPVKPRRISIRTWVAGIAIVFSGLAVFVAWYALIGPDWRTERVKDEWQQVFQAVMRYHAHNREWPSSLQSLVPDYITRIPEPPRWNVECGGWPSANGKAYTVGLYENGLRAREMRMTTSTHQWDMYEPDF